MIELEAYASRLFSGETVAIYREIREGSFEPADIARMTKAYEGALELLRPKDRTEAVKELIAKKIIEVTHTRRPASWPALESGAPAAQPWQD